MKYFFLLVFSFVILSVQTFAANYDYKPEEVKKGEIFQDGLWLSVEHGIVTITQFRVD